MKRGRRPQKTALPNGADGERYTFKMPKTRLPEPIMPGVRGWRTRDGWTVLRLHYSADPERADDGWLKREALGYRGGIKGRDWQREMEIDFAAYPGDPVYPEFDQAAIQPRAYDPNLPLWRGWDFGFRHPAVVFTQLDYRWDQFRYLHELYPTLNSERVPGMKTGDLAKLVIAETERLFPGAMDSEETAGVYDFCDPAGTQHKETSDFTSVEILQQHGINPEWNVVGKKNRINILRNFIESPGRFLINPHCALGIKALEGGYHYPDDKSGGMDRELPDLSKTAQQRPFVHLMDCIEYIAAVNMPIDDELRPTYGVAEEEENPNVGDLAEMYLQASAANDRRGRTPSMEDLSHDLEENLYDLVGEDGSLEDAFLLT